MKLINFLRKIIQIRTRMFTNPNNPLCTMLFMIICFQLAIIPIQAENKLTISNRTFENVIVQSILDNNTADNSRILLKISGLPYEIINDDTFKVKPTFSLNYCDKNASDFLKVAKLSNNLIVLLSEFNFNENTAAYLCLFHIKADIHNDNVIQAFHMGTQSKFQRNDGIRFRRNATPNRDFRLWNSTSNAFVTTKSDKINTIRIDGMRVEWSEKEVSYSDEFIPDFISRTKVTLRLFGNGFTEHMMITFTEQTNDYGGACLLPASGQFRVRKDTLREHTVLVDIVAPNIGSTYFYLCTKNADDITVEKRVDQAHPFVHQGTDPWLRITSSELVIPVWLSICIIVGCLAFSALFSGLNLGLMSLDRTELKILRNTGNEKERQYAKVIQPVRDHGNYLLCSILLGNVLVNSTFTILLDGLTSGLVAVVSSTLLIVIFGEITPQAICSRHGLAVGANTIFITKAVMVLTFPLAYPTSKFLDYLLGEEIGNVYNRERLKELVRVTNDINDLDKDEVNIISGALELRKKTVTQAMTHIEDAFMLSIDSILDFETVTEIMKSGFSRIPVYEGDSHNVVNLLLIKDLALVDPDDNTPLRTLCEFYQNYLFFVFEDVTLDVIFKQFKCGQQGHMAFVRHVNSSGDGDPFYETIGLITLEDVIEEMIQAEIMDETDVYTDNRSKKKRKTQCTRKQDFTIFAERRDNQRIRISPQLTLATFQYLSTTIDAFKSENLSETILRRLLNQDIYHHIKCKDKTNVATVIYQQGKPVDYFVLILEGRVEVTVGQENLLFECGPFTYFGTQALVQNVGVAENRQQIQGSLQSLNLDAIITHTFVPDYSVRAVTEVFYLTIKRTLYLAAKRASLMERSQRDHGSSIGPLDDEVEKLLHSLDEDERSISAHTSNLNTLTPKTSKPSSPSINNGPAALNETIAERENSTSVTFSPSEQIIQYPSPVIESEETDALLTPRS